MRFKNRTTPVVSIAILLLISVMSFMTVDERYVATPGFASVVIVLWLWMTLWDRDKKIPFFDVGVFCAIATLLYTVYPLVNYWIGGLQFGFLSDDRLHLYNPNPYELGYFHLRHVLYIFSFVIFYSIFRGRGSVGVGNVSIPSRSVRNVIVICFLLLTGYFFLLQLTTGVDYNPSYESEAYANNVIAFSSLPLLLSQVSGKLWGILFIFKLALLLIVICQSWQKKWRIILIVWVALEIVHVFYIKGARTGLVLFLMATALLYHRMIKPLSLKYLITSGASLFLLFTFLGIYRIYIDFASIQGHLSRVDAGIFSGGNEFQALLGTAYDVLQRKADGAHFPWYLYINDFIAILPPQQLLPFEKVQAAQWYLREIGLSGTGQGLMWGVITQSIVGLNWLELALRGAILGFILARFHRWYLKRQSGFLETLVYTFFCVKIYYTFRDTTFSLLANIVWEVIPFYILLRIGVAIHSRKVGDQPSHRIAMSCQNIK